MSHHVKTHLWDNGVLKTISKKFETLIEAMAFVKSSDAHAIKIYDDSGNLVHSAQMVNPEPPIINTYA
jgi:hypothetical protein